MTATARKPTPPQADAGAFSGILPAGAFAAAMGRAAAVVASRIVIPQAGDALLEFDDAGAALSITTTNLDQTLTVTIPAVGSGAITAPAHQLRTFLDRLDKDKDLALAMEADGRTLLMRQGRTSYRLPTRPVGDWPVMLREPPPVAITWEADAAGLADAIRALQDGVYDGADPNQSHLAGLFFDFAEAVPLLASTNRNTLGAVRLSGDSPAWPPEGCEHQANNPHGFILPREALRFTLDAATTAAKAGAPLRLVMAPEKLAVISPGAVLITKLIDGTFPDWRRVFPSDLPSRIAVDAAEFQAAVDCCAFIVSANPDSKSHKFTAAGLTIDFADGEIRIGNRNRLSGEEAASGCTAQLVDGEAATIGFNGAQLAWAIRSMGEVDTIQLAYEGPQRPVLLTVLGDDTSRHRRIVAPMAVG